MAGVLASGGGGAGGGSSRTIRDKAFNDLKRFNRGEDARQDRAYDFKMALGTQPPDLQKMLELIEEYPEELDLNKVKAVDPTRVERMNLAQRSAKLFQILVL